MTKQETIKKLLGIGVGRNSATGFINCSYEGNSLYDVATIKEEGTIRVHYTPRHSVKATLAQIDFSKRARKNGFIVEETIEDTSELVKKINDAARFPEDPLKAFYLLGVSVRQRIEQRNRRDG